MDSLGEEDENCHFFDAMEQSEDFCPSSVNSEYDLWIGPLRSIQERRNNFIREMGSDLNLKHEEAFVGEDLVVEREVSIEDTDRIMETSRAVLRTSFSEDNICSVSAKKFDESMDDEGVYDHFNFANRPGMSKGKTEVQDCSVTPSILDQLKGKWHRKWRSFGQMVKSKLAEHSVKLDDSQKVGSLKSQIVQARHFRKKLKELSAVFHCQNMQAHEGAILSMKFSPDGQYLASAGEDMVLRVWQVVEDERSNIIDITDVDSSFACFSMNHHSMLEHLTMNKKDPQKTRSIRKTNESSCIIFPHKVFRILEKPLHNFVGHNAAILDLSWSKKDRLLLSSSSDNTVRLWKIGVNECLKVFSHTDYVTCVRFNPVNDDYFISGSIDGKVRIWTISGSQVVFWSESKGIITAASYSPDGKSAVIGSMSGTCYFFKISDDQFLLESQVHLTSKRKVSCKRITGLEFLPQDPSKVLVACADSSIRVIQGDSVVAKYKGGGGHVSASLTPHRKHIISVSEDSSIYLWNYEAAFPPLKIVRSFESLPCDNVSIAVPWPGMKYGSSQYKIPLRQDSNSKIGATWPVEKLPVSTPKTVTSPRLGKSQYKLFKSFYQCCSNTHACGLIFVTAGWDGRIKSFHNYGLPVPL